MNLWRLSWRVAWNKPKQMILGTLLFWLFFAMPALIGFLIAETFDALAGISPEDGSGAGRVYWLAASIFGTEMIRLVTLFYAAVEYTKAWELQQSLLRSNMLRAQIASGTVEAGQPVASAGEAITHFRDDPRDVAELIDSWVDVSGGLLFTVIAVAVLGAVSPVATLVILVPLASVAVVTKVLDVKIKAYRTADRAATAAFTGLLGDVMASATTVKVNATVEPALAKLQGLADRRRHTAVRDRVLEDGLLAFSTGSGDLALGLVLLVSVSAIRSGQLGLANLALFVTYLTYLNFLPRMLGRMISRHKQSEVAFGNMRQLVGQRDANRTATHRPLPIDTPSVTRARAEVGTRRPLEVLEVEGLGATYEGGGGISGVSFVLPRGSFTVIAGPVGSGKSTLLRVLLGLEWNAKLEGSVRWNGEEVADRAAFFVPPNSAFLPQVPQLLSDTLHANVALGDREVGAEEMAKAIRLSALQSDVAEMSEGAETLVGPRGLRLSGGQRQRVAAARALVRMPELLVLDDVSSALDVETELELWRNLSEADITVLAVSHRKVAADLADQVLTFQNGHLL